VRSRDHARVLPQRAQELAVAGVDGVDARGARLEQRAGEPARSRSDVEGDASCHGNAHRHERVAELGLAAQRR
jgi:hypothetical protein